MRVSPDASLGAWDVHLEGGLLAAAVLPAADSLAESPATAAPTPCPGPFVSETEVDFNDWPFGPLLFFSFQHFKFTSKMTHYTLSPDLDPNKNRASLSFSLYDLTMCPHVCYVISSTCE